MLVLVVLCMLPTVTAMYYCTDSDGGANKWIEGSITVREDDYIVNTENDNCIGNELNEVYCLMDRHTSHVMVGYETYSCTAGCFDGACVQTECNDGADNDGDGNADYPDDAGCTSGSDNDENNCGDGICGGGETAADCTEDCSCSAQDGTCCDPVDSCDTPISGTECNCCSGECITCVPETEVCDSLDNDCDESIDEDFDLTSDDSNCGSCDTACAEDQSCIDSVCVDCTDEICDGFDNDCDGTPDNGFNFDNDAQNCGDCDVVCPGICSNGQCVYHDADEDESGDISITELGSYLNDWKDGVVSIIEFLDAASVWKE